MRYLLSLLLLCFSTISNAQIPLNLARRVDAVFSEYDRTNSPGCSLAILKDGKIIYERGYGMSNLEYNLAISPTSIFHIASISKQFTAAAIVRLSLEGKISLNDDIRKYIPEVPDFGHVITFNNLIHHTSGLRDQWVLQWLAGWREGDLITENDVLEMLTRQKALNFIPGEEYVYCNTGFTLAGIAVKRITGVSLRDYADSVFFKPLGMTNTHFHSDHAEITPNRTSAYVKDENGKWKISIPVFDNYGATSLFTTVEDLAKWDENFYSHKIGGDSFINAMVATSVLNDKTAETYASGLVLGNYKGYKTEEHNGADAGYRSNFIRFPEEHFSIIILANLANHNPRFIYQVADIFLKDKSVASTHAVTDSTILKGWAGDYFDSQTQSRLTIDYKFGKLFSRMNEMLPSSNTDFKVASSIFTFGGDSVNAILELNTKGTKIRKYTKLKKITLSPSAIQEYAGEYYSPELDTKYKVYLKDSSLVFKIPRMQEIDLPPFVKDVFGDRLIVRFSRNKKNVVDGFYLSNDRMRNLYFERVTGKLK